MCAAFLVAGSRPLSLRCHVDVVRALAPAPRTDRLNLVQVLLIPV